MNKYDFTVVSGVPGAGKSAIIKDVLNSNFKDSNIFVFRADQFNQPHLSNVFTNIGINESLKNIFSCLSLVPYKILFIDSLEKLLEGNPENAFKQFLSSYKEFGNLKIIFASRKYALQLLVHKYGIQNINEVEITQLTDEDLEKITELFPKLKPLCKNPKILQLLKSPKYLDFTVSLINKSNDDFSEINLVDFKNKLWKHIVENDEVRNGGLPAKRGKAFLNIAVQRAKKMRLFIKPIDVDDYAVDQLENDNVIFKDPNERLYSPSHDILEDWALVKYIKEQYDRLYTPIDFFKNIGNEPAIRRAFRLWIEDTMLDKEEIIFELVDSIAIQSEVEKYWSDELLIAIFKSDLSYKFFQKYQEILIDKDASFLNRCLHIIRTACKEQELKGENNSTLLFPIGTGWKEAIKFIQANLALLDNQRLIVVNVLMDWQLIIYKTDSKFPEEAVYVRDIILHYIKQIESHDEFWQSDIIGKKRNELIILLLSISKIAKSEINELIKKAQLQKTNRDNWKLIDFYEKIIEYSLSGLYSRFLARELPELIFEVANHEWKIKEEENQNPHHKSYRQTEIEEYFGLEHYPNYFPAGIYKTPIYNLLWSHPYKTMHFIVEFIDYATLNYIKSEFSKGDEPKEIEVKLNDGKSIKQWGSWVLWHMYRGTGKATPYLLQSILMSLEKFLLEISVLFNSDNEKQKIKSLYKYLLSHSHSVAITSVLASVTMAYPEIIEDALLPILRVKEFYKWDLTRALQESSSFATMDNDISFAQKERYESNQLPHRKKYHGGLRNFVVYYQFNIRKLNKEIQIILDNFSSNAVEDDIIWKKALNEMDIRKYEVGEYDKELGGFRVGPKYEGDVDEFVKSNEPEHEKRNKSLTLFNWITKVYEEDKEIDKNFDKWEECYDYYIVPENKNIYYDRPASLAIIGLRDYDLNLSDSQKQWCVDMLLNSIQSILRDTYQRNLLEISQVNVLDKVPTLKSFTLLFDNLDTEENINELMRLLFYTIKSPFIGNEIGDVISNIRDEFSLKHTTIAQRIWLNLLSYSKFSKSNRYFYDDPDRKRLKNALEKENEFIENLIENNIDVNPDLENITLSDYNPWFLSRTFEIIPYQTNNSYQLDFIKVYLHLIINDLQQKENYFNDNKMEHFRYETISETSIYLSMLIFKNDLNYVLSIIDILFESTKILEKRYNYKNDRLYEFLHRTFERIIYSLDKMINDNNINETEQNELIKRFWKIWENLFEKIKGLNKKYFTDILFLDIMWFGNETHWKPLKDKQLFYKQMCEELGSKNLKHILKLMSTVGDKTILPDGLSWLVNLCKGNKDQIAYLLNPSGERLIERLFQKHLFKIKSNSILIKDFIWLLDNMIDLGSSNAYLIREYVITYKKSK